MRRRSDGSMTKALKPYGIHTTEDFWKRYHTDPLVFNLANIVEILTERLADV